MPATVDDIAAGTRPAVTVTWSDVDVRNRYPSAQDGLTTPIDTWLDDEDDAQDLVDARGALFGVERQRFAVKVDGIEWLDPTAGLPQAHLIDDALNADVATLAPRFAVDLDAEQTTFELIG